ncbi:MAG: hypothetical protein U0271_41875 [Polyangiaceae bacterium]
MVRLARSQVSTNLTGRAVRVALCLLVPTAAMLLTGCPENTTQSGSASASNTPAKVPDGKSAETPKEQPSSSAK